MNTLNVDDFIDANVVKLCTHTNNIESQIGKRAEDVQVEGEFLGIGHFVPNKSCLLGRETAEAVRNIMESAWNEIDLTVFSCVSKGLTVPRSYYEIIPTG